MKFFETALSASVLLYACAEASRHAEEPHHDRVGTTRAVCSWNTQGDRVIGRSSSFIELEQKRDAPTEIEAYIGFLDEGASYSLALFDNNADACTGTKISTIGSFTASDRRRG